MSVVDESKAHGKVSAMKYTLEFSGPDGTGVFNEAESLFEGDDSGKMPPLPIVGDSISFSDGMRVVTSRTFTYRQTPGGSWMQVVVCCEHELKK